VLADDTVIVDLDSIDSTDVEPSGVPGDVVFPGAPGTVEPFDAPGAGTPTDRPGGVVPSGFPLGPLVVPSAVVGSLAVDDPTDVVAPHLFCSDSLE
jgi:hypothetical protein